MNPSYLIRHKMPPSESYRAYASEFGPVVKDYDPLGQLILAPGLIAARGRAHSFAGWKNAITESLEVECHYIESARMDAFATNGAATYCLGVFDAVAYATLDMFSFLFSAPTFFPSIGDASLEETSRVTARLKPVGYGFFRRSGPLEYERDIAPPRCPFRGQAALYFSGIALDLIWTHELSHAIHGHIDFARTRMNLRALNETPSGEGDLRLMPMEAEADRFAIGSVLQVAMVGGAPYVPRSVSDLKPEVRVAAVLVVAALLSWFWAFQQRIDRTYEGVDPYASGSHPPPIVRLHMAFDMARSFLKQQGWPDMSIQHVIFEAMTNMEALSIAKDWFRILDPARAFGGEATRHVKDVKAIMGEAFREIESPLGAYRFQAR